jgi:hypothetical protein
MKNRFLQYAFLSCSLMILFSACRKESFKGKETLNAGKTYVYFDAGSGGNVGQEVDYHYAIFTDVITQPFFILRRDAHNNSDLQKAITVTAQISDLAAYNTANQTNYEPIPSNVGTPIADPNITTTATTVTFKMGAGVFAMNYGFSINGANFDASKKYAMLLVITDFGGFSKKHNDAGASLDTLLITLGVKNQYDGDYTANGTISFPDPTSNRSWADRTKTLSTVNATTNETEAADLGGSGYMMYLKVNADNTVTVTPAPTAPNQTIQNNGPCTYDPATKTYTLNYKYIGGTGDRVIHDVLVAN